MADKTLDPDDPNGLADGGAVQSGDRVHGLRGANSRSIVLGSAAAQDSTAFATAAQGALADSAVQPGDIGNAASRNVGTTAGTVAAGDDSRITGAAQKSANLSDLASAATAFGNIKQAASTSASGVVEIATAAEYATGTDTARALGVAEVWDAAEPVNLGGSLSGNLTLDFATFIHAYGTLAANVTVNAVSNLKAGQSGTITLTNTGGAFTLSVNTAVAKTPSGGALVIGSGENKLSYMCDRDGKVFLTVAGKAVA